VDGVPRRGRGFILQKNNNLREPFTLKPNILYINIITTLTTKPISRYRNNTTHKKKHPTQTLYKQGPTKTQKLKKNNKP
jgi:hypothetical protein